MKTPTLNHTRSRPVVAWLSLALLSVGFVAGVSGCRGERTNSPPRQILPDMDDSPKHTPQSEAPFFADRRSLRPAVAGTVAFGRSADASDIGRSWFVKDDPALFKGLSPASTAEQPAYVGMIPASVMNLVVAEQRDRGVELDALGAMNWMIDRGRERFNIYCAACHGYNGEGGGPTENGLGYGGLVGRRWSYAVPGFHDEKYRDRDQPTGSDGYIFHVIRNGVPNLDGKPPKMPAYADKVNHRDAWSIVAYIRVLQAARASATTVLGDSGEGGEADSTSRSEVIQ